MASTRDLNQKINSLGNMQKVMRAMNMIATVKLRKLFPGLPALEEFTRHIEEFRQGVKGGKGTLAHPMVQGYRAVKVAHVVLFTADKGLCGAHNNHVLKALDLLRTRKNLENVQVEVTCIGNKGAIYAKRKKYPLFHRTSIHENVLDAQEIHALGKRILDRYLSGEIQEIHVIFNRFVSPLQQDTQCACLLPLASSESLTGHHAAAHEASEPAVHQATAPHGSPALPQGEGRPAGGGFPGEAETAPGPDGFAPAMAQTLFLLELQAAKAHSTLSEQASRMTAMENASNNSKELISRYVLLRNRARQASITNELIEIISGKEAMKG